MSDVTWYVFGLMLTVIGLLLSYRAYQKRGLAGGVRGTGWSLLPLALALTGTLELVGELTDDVTRWAANLVFSPLVWLGIAIGAVSVSLIIASGWLRRRGIGGRTPAGTTATSAPSGRSAELPAAGARKPASAVDDELADIEAILRKHGIQ